MNVLLLMHAILQNLYILRTLDGRAPENKIPADMMRFPAGLPATIGWLCQWYVISHTSQTCWILIIEPITCRTFPVVLAEQFRHLENSSIIFSSNTKNFFWSCADTPQDVTYPIVRVSYPIVYHVKVNVAGTVSKAMLISTFYRDVRTGGTFRNACNVTLHKTNGNLQFCSVIINEPIQLTLLYFF